MAMDFFSKITSPSCLTSPLSTEIVVEYKLVVLQLRRWSSGKQSHIIVVPHEPRSVHRITVLTERMLYDKHSIIDLKPQRILVEILVREAKKPMFISQSTKLRSC